MEESMFKKIWNYSITIGQLIITAFVMAVITGVAYVVFSLFKPSKK